MAKAKRRTAKPNSKRRPAKKKNAGRKGAFGRCVAAVKKAGSARSPRGVCAAAGRRKYGASEFQRMAAAGRKAAARANRKKTTRKKKGRKNPIPAVLAEAAAQRVAGDKRAAALLKRASGSRRYFEKTNAPKRKKQSRKNPLGAARVAFRDFHGRNPDKIVVTREKVHYHKVLSGIGELVKLVIVTPDGRAKVTVNFPGGKTLLAQNEKRNQLFLRGGDQSVRLADFGIFPPYHEREVLGELEKVYYFTRKDHLRPEDGGTAVYRHSHGKLREVKIGGRIKNKRWARPTVIYDTVDKLIEFAGGSYTILSEGIDR